MLDEGGYDQGGAYWGLGEPVFGARSTAGADGQPQPEAVFYVRAASRDAAKAEIVARDDGAVFDGEEE